MGFLCLDYSFTVVHPPTPTGISQAFAWLIQRSQRLLARNLNIHRVFNGLMSANLQRSATGIVTCLNDTNALLFRLQNAYCICHACPQLPGASKLPVPDSYLNGSDDRFGRSLDRRLHGTPTVYMMYALSVFPPEEAAFQALHKLPPLNNMKDKQSLSILVPFSRGDDLRYSISSNLWNELCSFEKILGDVFEALMVSSGISYIPYGFWQADFPKMAKRLNRFRTLDELHQNALDIQGGFKLLCALLSYVIHAHLTLEATSHRQSLRKDVDHVPGWVTILHNASFSMDFVNQIHSALTNARHFHGGYVRLVELGYHYFNAQAHNIAAERVFGVFTRDELVLGKLRQWRTWLPFFTALEEALVLLVSVTKQSRQLSVLILKF